MAGMYTLALLRHGARAEWSRLMPFANDSEAIAAARRIAESHLIRTPGSASLMVGRTWDEGGVVWLGGWDCDPQEGFTWEAEETGPDAQPGA
jgi:hypothetical protein